MSGYVVGAVPAGTWLADGVQVVGLNDRPAALALGSKRREELVGGLVRGDIPPPVAMVSPRVGDVASGEPPLQPAQLDESEVLDQLERGPARLQTAAALFVIAELAYLVDDPGAEVVEVADEDLGSRRGRHCRAREGIAHLPVQQGHGGWRACALKAIPKRSIKRIAQLAR